MQDFATSIRITTFQIGVLFLLMGIGVLIYRKGWMDSNGTKQIANLLARVVSPLLLISSFQRAFDPTLAHTLFWILWGGILTFGIAIVLSHLLYRPNCSNPPGTKRMCAIFPNNGFMALPLLDALFGATGVLLGSVHIVLSNVFFWTYGRKQLSPHAVRLSLKDLLCNPGIVAFCGGLLLFVSPVKLPSLLYTAFSYVGSMNTPLAMLLLGCYIAQVDFQTFLTQKALWGVVFARLLFIPIMTLPFLFLLPLDHSARMILLIGFSTPVAINVATFAQLFGGDYTFSSRAIALSTLGSLCTLPLLIGWFTVLSQWLRIL